MEPDTFQSTNQPINPSPTPTPYNPEQVVGEVEPREEGQNNSVLIILSLFLIVLVGVVAFLAYQNYQLQTQIGLLSVTTPIPSPTATSDPTANWKTYTNQQYLYEFKCPPTSIYKKTPFTMPNGLTFPYFQESCIELQDQINISVWKIINQDVFTLEGKTKELLGASLKPSGYNESTLGQYKMITYQEQNITDAIERSVAIIVLKDKYIEIDGFSQKYFDQILSTFKFTEASGSGSPTPAVTACTQEAKICPDGSSVGRTAPNCEFTACP